MSLLLFLVFTFMFGTLMGSFITALVWRMRRGRSMLERHSVCPQCQHTLHAIDLIPVLSYLLQRGRCRYCHAPISVQYPLIELATASVLVLTTWLVIGQQAGWQIDMSVVDLSTGILPPWSPGVLLALATAWVAAILLIALFIYDLQWGELPNQWTLGGAAAAVMALLIAVGLNLPVLWQPLAADNNTIAPQQLLPTANTLFSSLAAGLGAAAFFLLIAILSENILKKPGLGMGDVKLALFMGFLLGFPAVVVALYLAFILGAVLSLVLISAKRKQFGMAIPFGPFLVIGTFIAWWLTPTVMTWYQQLLP